MALYYDYETNSFKPKLLPAAVSMAFERTMEEADKRVAFLNSCLKEYGYAQVSKEDIGEKKFDIVHQKEIDDNMNALSDTKKALIERGVSEDKIVYIVKNADEARGTLFRDYKDAVRIVQDIKNTSIVFMGPKQKALEALAVNLDDKDEIYKLLRLSWEESEEDWELIKRANTAKDIEYGDIKRGKHRKKTP